MNVEGEEKKLRYTAKMRYYSPLEAKVQTL